MRSVAATRSILADPALDAPNEADESHELTYADIDSFLFLASF